MSSIAKSKTVRSKSDKINIIKYAIVFTTNIVVILYVLYIASAILVATTNNEEIVNNIEKGVEIDSELKVSKDNSVFEYEGEKVQVPLSRTYYTRSIGNKEQKVYYNKDKDILVVCLGKWHFLGVASKTPCIIILITDICLVITDIIEKKRDRENSIDKRDKYLINMIGGIVVLLILLTYVISGV